ncbi:TetR/AcrR family transcriptional regulator [Kiloniella sp. b19]|uniref:TetR/AcrR family transcriptional regulator n=1 Tax=Kiloniella sp. GXU_MW_B19 TaxID=3141326 RepID=UPI0031E3D670
MPRSDTAKKLLDLARNLTQKRGFNGFSFHTLADGLGIKTASVHYHFPTKGHLAKAMMDDYLVDFKEALEKLDRDYPENPAERLKAYLNNFSGLIEDEHFCLCGMLTAECDSLEEDTLCSLETFYKLNQKWLQELLREGAETGAFKFNLKPECMAAIIFSGIEGGLLIYRKNDPARFKAHCVSMLELVRAG